MSIFYANSAGSQGTGDGSTEANACTLKQAVENDGVLHTSLAAGDTIYCKGGTTITYDGSAGVFVTIAVDGTAASPIKLISYTTTVNDGGVTTIEDSNAGATNYCFNISAADFWYVQGLKIINPRRAFECGSNQGCHFVDIEVVGGVQQCFNHSGTNVQNIYDRIYIHDCTYIGIIEQSRSSRIINSVIINCGDLGISALSASYGTTILSCIIHKCDGIAINYGAVVKNCVINRSVNSGIVIANDYAVTIENTVISNSGGYAYEATTSATVIARNNCVYNPISGKSSGGITIIDDRGEITSDPTFVSENPATPTDADFTPDTGSPLINSGIGPVGY